MIYIGRYDLGRDPDHTRKQRPLPKATPQTMMSIPLFGGGPLPDELRPWCTSMGYLKTNYRSRPAASGALPAGASPPPALPATPPRTPDVGPSSGSPCASPATAAPSPGALQTYPSPRVHGAGDDN